MKRNLGCKEASMSAQPDSATPRRPGTRKLTVVLLAVLLAASGLAVLYSPATVTGTKLQVRGSLPTASSPNDIEIDQMTNTVYVVAAGDYSTLKGGMLQRINGTSGLPEQGIQLSGIADFAALDPISGIIYATVGAYPMSIVAINTSTGIVLKSLNIGNHGEQVDLTIDPTLGRLYAAVYPSSVLMIDAKTLEVIQNVTTGDYPGYITVNQMTHRVYVVGMNHSREVLLTLDGLSGKLISNLTLGMNYGGVAVDSVTNRVYVGGGIFGPLFVIDGATNRVIVNVTTGGPTWESDGVAVDLITNVVYVVSNNVPHVPAETGVFAINGTTNTVMANATFTAPRGSIRIAVDSDTHMVYMAGPGNNVTIIGGFGSADPPKVVTAWAGRGVPLDLYLALPAASIVLAALLAYSLVRRPRPDSNP